MPVSFFADPHQICRNVLITEGENYPCLVDFLIMIDFIIFIAFIFLMIRYVWDNVNSFINVSPNDFCILFSFQMVDRGFGS